MNLTRQLRVISQKFSHTRSLSSKSSNTSCKEVDIAIIGGGIVGASLAASLCKSKDMENSSILLLESKAPKPFKDVISSSIPDPRVYALAPASIDLLKDIGVWDACLSSNRATPYDHMQVWDSSGTGYVRFDAGDTANSSSDNSNDNKVLEEQQLGYIVEHALLQSSLYEHLSQLKDTGRLDLLTPSSVQSIHLPTSFRSSSSSSSNQHPWPTITLDDGSKVKARLVVAADGANSKVREYFGIGKWQYDYEQRAVVASVRMSRSHHTTWQRFLPNGPVAILPLWDDLSTIVWSTTPEEATELQSLEPKEFINRLENALFKPSTGSDWSSIPLVGNMLNTCSNLTLSMFHAAASFQGQGASFVVPPTPLGVVGPRLSFPLRASHTHKYITSNAVLIGDAAHTVHPLAGQGLNLGLGDVTSLVQVLSKASYAGLNIGDTHVLEKYEIERRKSNLLMTAGIHAIGGLFYGSSAPLQSIRNIGLGAVNALGPFKQHISKYAMGLRS